MGIQIRLFPLTVMCKLHTGIQTIIESLQTSTGLYLNQGNQPKFGIQRGVPSVFGRKVHEGWFGADSGLIRGWFGADSRFGRKPKVFHLDAILPCFLLQTSWILQWSDDCVNCRIQFTDNDKQNLWVPTYWLIWCIRYGTSYSNQGLPQIPSGNGVDWCLSIRELWGLHISTGLCTGAAGPPMPAPRRRCGGPLRPRTGHLRAVGTYRSKTLCST